MSKTAKSTLTLLLVILLATVQGYFISNAVYHMHDHVVVDGQDCHIEQINRGGQDLFGPQTPGDEVLVIAHCAK